MRCNKARDFISQQLDAVLPPDATGKLGDHLDTCADCREYREDLQLSQRLLTATEPTLPDNFEWKLQLKLNQALQQSAGEVQYPWHEKATDRWAWLRNFGAATAVGLAAVLALAMFFGPGTDHIGGPAASRLASTQTADQRTDRLPLFQAGTRGLYQTGAQRAVSAGGSSLNGARSGYIDRGWSGSGTEDLLIIQRLRDQNQRLGNMLLQYQRANEMLRAQLDTNGTDALDLQQEQ